MVFFSLYLLIFATIVSGQSFSNSKINSTTPIYFYNNDQPQQDKYGFYLFGILSGLSFLYCFCIFCCCCICYDLKFKNRSHQTQSTQINGLSSLQLEIPVYSVKTIENKNNENRNKDLPRYDEISISKYFDELPSYSSYRENIL